jgi:two-component system LytT family response regulator
LLDALRRVRERRNARRARKDRQSLLKLVSEIAGTVINSVEDIAAKGIKALKQEPSRLAIKDAGKTTWVLQEDIEWIDAAGDYMCVHVRGQTLIMRTTMKELDQHR